MTVQTSEQSEFAPAKINLTLRIGRKRADGYHDLESLVVFAATVGDSLKLAPDRPLGLDTDGPTAIQAGPADDNLVLRATRALQAGIPSLRTGRFHLTKRTPVAAGLGGGSSDAAAALRLLTRLNGLSPQDHQLMQAARVTGADIPVCLDPRPRVMRGIGEVLSEPLRLPVLHAVLVNPGVPVPTGRIFGALASDRAGIEAVPVDNDPAFRCVDAGVEPSFDELVTCLRASSNDLEPPAVRLFPAVGDALAALRAMRFCSLARMSGSGGTCFGLFPTAADAVEAAGRLSNGHPLWWVQATLLGAAPANPSVQ